MNPERFRIELRQRPPRTRLRRPILGGKDADQPRYEVVLNGLLYDSLNFTGLGYVGYLPVPPHGQRLLLGEAPLARYQAEVDRLNRGDGPSVPLDVKQRHQGWIGLHLLPAERRPQRAALAAADVTATATATSDIPATASDPEVAG